VTNGSVPYLYAVCCCKDEHLALPPLLLRWLCLIPASSDIIIRAIPASRSCAVCCPTAVTFPGLAITVAPAATVAPTAACITAEVADLVHLDQELCEEAAGRRVTLSAPTAATSAATPGGSKAVNLILVFKTQQALEQE
jgi:hypothetical protein